MIAENAPIEAKTPGIENFTPQTLMRAIHLSMRRDEQPIEPEVTRAMSAFRTDWETRAKIENKRHFPAIIPLGVQVSADDIGRRTAREIYERANQLKRDAGDHEQTLDDKYLEAAVGEFRPREPVAIEAEHELNLRLKKIKRDIDGGHWGGAGEQIANAQEIFIKTSLELDVFLKNVSSEVQKKLNEYTGKKNGKDFLTAITMLDGRLKEPYQAKAEDLPEVPSHKVQDPFWQPIFNRLTDNLRRGTSFGEFKVTRDALARAAVDMQTIQKSEHITAPVRERYISEFRTALSELAGSFSNLQAGHCVELRKGYLDAGFDEKSFMPPEITVPEANKALLLILKGREIIGVGSYGDKAVLIANMGIDIKAFARTEEANKAMSNDLGSVFRDARRDPAGFSPPELVDKLFEYNTFGFDTEGFIKSLNPGEFAEIMSSPTAVRAANEIFTLAHKKDQTIADETKKQLVSIGIPTSSIKLLGT